MPPKRKSTTTPSSSKKPKPPPTVTLGKSALKSHTNGEALTEAQIDELASYTQHLETLLSEYQKAETSLSHKGGKELSDAEISSGAERLRGVVERGIVKLMKVG